MRVSRPWEPGVIARGISLATTTDSVVQKNNVHDNSDSGIFLGAGATGNLIENNSSSNNARGTPEPRSASTSGAPRTGVNAQPHLRQRGLRDQHLERCNRLRRHEQRQLRQRRPRDRQQGIERHPDPVQHHLPLDELRHRGRQLHRRRARQQHQRRQRPRPRVQRWQRLRRHALRADHHPGLRPPVPGRSGSVLEFNGVEYASLAASSPRPPARRPTACRRIRSSRTSATNNFALGSGSPAKDSANSGVADHPQFDKDGKPRKDLTNVPDTGVGPRTYDDRGAYEAPK